MLLEQKDRRILPRLRDFWTTLALGELSNSKPPGPISEEDRNALTQRASELEKDRTIWHAADLLSSAFVVNDRERLEEAASFVLEHRQSAPPPLVAMAARVRQPSKREPVDDVETIEAESIARSIHAVRTRLHDEPRNAIQWVELARLYTLLGESTRALRSIRVATALGRDNRFVVRSAARLFVHERDTTGALRVIRGAAGARTDPWLLAAEIGVSSFSKSPSLLAKVGRKRNDDDALSAFERTELSGALATLDLENGKNRQARQLFRQSLTNPNENSVAQVEWANRQIGGLDVRKGSVLHVPRSFEANAQVSLINGDWSNAIQRGTQWLQDQPFSRSPAIFTSYVSSLVEEYDRSIDLLRGSLKLNPGDEILMNNLAFALASANRIEEAELVLRGADYKTASSTSAVTLAATHGLLLFRRGYPDQGRVLYQLAIEKAGRMGIPNYQLMAGLYLAREEFLAGTAVAFDTAKRYLAAAAKAADKDVGFLAKRVQRIVDEASSSGVGHITGARSPLRR